MEKEYKELSTFSKYRTQISVLGMLLMFFLGYTTHDLVTELSTPKRNNMMRFEMDMGTMERGMGNLLKQRQQREMKRDDQTKMRNQDEVRKFRNRNQERDM